MIRRLLPSFLLLAAAGAGALAPAATAAPRAPHIAFGTPLVDSTSAPWAVLLERLKTDGTYTTYCSANLVNATTIVTAAHCAVDKGKVLAPALFRVQAGGVAENQPGTQMVGVAGIAVHPNYRGFRYGSDVSVMSLAAPLTLSPTVQPIGVAPSGSSVGLGKKLGFFGWGTTESGQPQGLRSMTTRALLSGICASGVPGVLCAYNRKQAPCPGDSGGGLVRINAAGAPELVGVDSFGGAKCRPGQPDGFADLTQPSLNSWLGGVFTGQATKPKPGPRATRRPTVRPVSSSSPVLRCTGARWKGESKVRTLWLYGNGKVFKKGKSHSYRARKRDVGKPIYCASQATSRNGSASVISRRGYRFYSLG